MGTIQVYTSFEDAVDTEYDGSLDGDDSGPLEDIEDRTTLRAKIPPPPAGWMAARGLLVPKESMVVPYVEGLNEGDSSDAVYAMKRAWARREGGGRLTVLERKSPAVKRKWQPSFSKEFGARSYTRARHQRLGPWYDAKALRLLRSATAVSARDRQISVQLAWLNAVYNRRWAIPYSQARPSQLVSPARLTRCDCSGGVAGSAAWANILPKVDWRYTNTWTQQHFGWAVDGVNEALPGDIILYGSPSHVAVYLGKGIVWSFGSYPVKILPYNYRHDRRIYRRLVAKR